MAGVLLIRELDFLSSESPGRCSAQGGGYYQSATSEKTVRDQRDPIKSETPKKGIGHPKLLAKAGENTSNEGSRIKKNGGHGEFLNLVRASVLERRWGPPPQPPTPLNVADQHLHVGEGGGGGGGGMPWDCLPCGTC